MTLTAIKIYDNTNTNECVKKTVVGRITSGGTYAFPEGRGFGTATILCCKAQSNTATVLVTIATSASGNTATFTSAKLGSNSIISFEYTFLK